MELRNKKTGQLGLLNVSFSSYQVTPIEKPLSLVLAEYETLDALMQEWEDYEESERIIGICQALPACPSTVNIEMATEEQAEQAVKKLKAWKRIKDKGFQFESWFGGSKDISFWLDTEIDENIAKDLDLLFGGEEE